MDAYLTCLQEPPVVPPPPKACDPVVGCPPGPVVPAAVKCALIEISGECEHHGEAGARVAREDLTLEVVPSSYGSDKIELRANVQKACGAHPSWTISENGTQTGQKASFSASGPVVQKFLLWLPSISPREYAVTCSTCNGSASLQVHAYPPNEFAFNLDAKKGVIKVIKKILHVAEKVLDAISGKFEWKWLEGKLNAEASWKEYKDYRAYYGYKIDVNLTPLIGGTFGWELSSDRILKIVEKIPGIGRYVKRAADWLGEAKVFVEISGGITCEIKCERESPDQPKFIRQVSKGAGGKVEIGVGAKGGLLGDENGVAYVELETAGAITGGGKPFLNDEGWGLEEFKIELEPVKGTFRLCLLCGLVDIDPSVVLIKAPAKPLYGPTTWLMFKNGAPDEGAAGEGEE